MTSQNRPISSTVHDDFTMSDIDSELAEPPRINVPMPMKSTLPSNVRWGMNRGGDNLNIQDFGRRRDNDITMSTEMGNTAHDEYERETDHANDSVRYPYGDESLIPGVGRGIQRPNGGASTYSAHRDILNFNSPNQGAKQYAHPSPATNARYNAVHSTKSTGPAQRRARTIVESSGRRLDRGVASNPSSSGSDTDSTMTSESSAPSEASQNRKGQRHNDSTGNHNELAATPMGQSVAHAPKTERPRLGSWALDELDWAMGHKASNVKRMDIPASPTFYGRVKNRPSDSPSPAPSLRRTGRSEKEAARHDSPPRRLRSKGILSPVSASDFGDAMKALGKDIEGVKDGQDEENDGSNGSGYAAGPAARKVSGGSAATNSSGETLVGSGQGYVHQKNRRSALGEVDNNISKDDMEAYLKLPSGQRMGTGAPRSGMQLPDLTGMTSALESPVKTKLGVQHKGLDLDSMQDRVVKKAGGRTEELNELAWYVKGVESELGKTQRRVEEVETGQSVCVHKVESLRQEWDKYLKSERGPSSDEVETARQDRLYRSSPSKRKVDQRETYGDKIGQMNAHIAKLNADLVGYRSAMEELRREENEAEERERLMREQVAKKNAARSHQAFSSPRKPSSRRNRSHVKQGGPSEERGEIDALREQVEKVATEVDRLRSIVDDGNDVAFHLDSLSLADEARSDSHMRNHNELSRHRKTRFVEDGLPLHTSSAMGGRSPFARRPRSGERNVSGNAGSNGNRLGQSQDQEQGTGSSSERIGIQTSKPPSSPVMQAFEDEEEEEGDETARPIHGPSDRVEENDAEITRETLARAEKVLKAMEASEETRKVEEVALRNDSNGQARADVKGALAHDEARCTVCAARRKSERKREARRDRNAARARKASSHVDEEFELLSFLEGAHWGDGDGRQKGCGPELGCEQLKVLRRLIREHLDEFIHHRMLYCELADELKLMEPSMSRTKRRILAEHVLEAVEALEWKAQRVNALQGMLPDANSVDLGPSKGQSKSESSVKPGRHGRK